MTGIRSSIITLKFICKFCRRTSISKENVHRESNTRPTTRAHNSCTTPGLRLTVESWKWTFLLSLRHKDPTYRTLGCIATATMSSAVLTKLVKEYDAVNKASAREGGWFSVAYDTKAGRTDKFTWVITFKGPEKCVHALLRVLVPVLRTRWRVFGRRCAHVAHNTIPHTVIRVVSCVWVVFAMTATP